MTITVAGYEPIPAHVCQHCGARDSNAESMANHEARHEFMQKWMRAPIEGVKRFMNNDEVGCSTVDCKRVAVITDKCQRCYQRAYAKVRKRRMEQP